MTDPKWRQVYRDDDSIVIVDEAGECDPMMEVAPERDVTEDGEGKVVRVYSFDLDHLKMVSYDGARFLVPEAYEEGWHSPVHQYQEWFTDSLGGVASFIGTTEQDLRRDLCSEDVLLRARAYRAIGDYHGFENLDSYPSEITVEELEERWSE